jgi:hypothetical protein
MITNHDVYAVWFELSDSEKVRIINKFNLEEKDPKDFLDQNDIRKYLMANYISKRKVVIK